MRSLPKCFALMLLLAMLPAHAEVLEGLWNLTLTMRVDGTAQPFGPYTQSQCFTQADTRDPGKLFGESGGAGCEYTNKRYYAYRFNFNIRCGSSIPLNGMGEVEFGRDGFEGQMDLAVQTDNGPSVETHSQVSGQRLGPCPK